MTQPKNLQAKIDLISEKIKLLHSFKSWELVLIPWLRTELTYTSNNLEGNTLSLVETSIVINDNQSVAGKNLREIYEAQNHAAAFDFIQNNLITRKTEDLTEDYLLHIHSLILKNIDEANAGKYRNTTVRIAGSNSIFPNSIKVPNLMSEVFVWLKNQPLENLRNILETAIVSHLKIVKIHPFADGNGRTTRLFMNTILMQNNLPPIDILPEKRTDYLESLEISTPEKPDVFLEFCLTQYLQNLDVYLETFSGT